MSFPVNVGQIPLSYNELPTGRPFDANNKYTSKYNDVPWTPLYPFGFGLSYTQFQYGNARVEASRILTQGVTHVSVEIENIGRQPGVETVQLYLRERFTPVSTPLEQLRGFERVELAPGQKKTVIFNLGPEDLKLLNKDMHWVVVPGTFDIMIGHSSTDIAAKATLEVQQNQFTTDQP